MRLISQALPVTSSATRSSAPRLWANSSSSLRRGLDPPRRADLAVLGDRHLAEVEVDVQSDRSHLLLLSLTEWETRWANDIDAFALSAQPDKSQGRPLKSPGSKPIVQEPAYPSCVLPEAPVPVSRP